MQDLDRDYGVLKKNYQELVSRREAAQIADNADTKTEKIQFRIVDPPQLPLYPVEPNRPMLVSVVLLFGMGAGLAAPLVMAQLDRSFCDDRPAAQPRHSDPGQRYPALARRRQAARGDPAGRGLRQRIRADRGLWHIAGAELRPPFGGRDVIWQSRLD